MMTAMPRVDKRANDRNDVADLGRVESGQHFVEQQKFRLGRKRPRKLKALSPGDSQGMRRPVEHVAEADFASNLLRRRRCAAARAR